MRAHMVAERLRSDLRTVLRSTRSERPQKSRNVKPNKEEFQNLSPTFSIGALIGERILPLVTAPSDEEHTGCAASGSMTAEKNRAHHAHDSDGPAFERKQARSRFRAECKTCCSKTFRLSQKGKRKKGGKGEGARRVQKHSGLVRKEKGRRGEREKVQDVFKNIPA